MMHPWWVIELVFIAVILSYIIWIHLSYWSSFKEIARHFNGRIRINPLVGTSCRFFHGSMPTKVAIVNGGKGGPDRLVLSVRQNRCVFNMHLTRKRRTAVLCKQQLWGPFSRKIQTGIPELDEKMIIYTKHERDVTDYLENAPVRNIITSLANDGWEDLYFTSKGMKIEKPSPSAADFCPDYLRVTLEKLHSLQMSYDNLYEPNQALQRTRGAEL